MSTMIEDEYEYETKTFPVNSELVPTIEDLGRDGWDLIPGLQPVAVYPLRRLRVRAAEAPLMAKLTIDESKVQIIRNGQIVTE